jgi:hypothetical protein
LAFSPNTLKARSLIVKISHFLNLFLVLIRRKAVKQLTNKSQDKPIAAPMYPTSLNPAGITINAIPI